MSCEIWVWAVRRQFRFWRGMWVTMDEGRRWTGARQKVRTGARLEGEGENEGEGGGES